MIFLCLLIYGITVFAIPAIIMCANDDQLALYLIAGIVVIGTIGIFITAWMMR